MLYIAISLPTSNTLQVLDGLDELVWFIHDECWLVADERAPV
jgi:hypothetical protein